jgi:hypothetical protein
MTRAQVLKLIGLIKAAWPRDEMSPETARAYAEDLIDLEHEAALAAFLAIRRSSKWRPHQSEIREAVAERTLAIPSPADAWHEVQEAIRGYDDYDEARKWPDWSHDLIRQTVRDLGGLRALYYSQMPGADRAHFLALYRELRGEIVEKATTAQLPAPAPVHSLPAAEDDTVAQLRASTAKSLRAETAQSDSEAS